MSRSGTLESFGHLKMKRRGMQLGWLCVWGGGAEGKESRSYCGFMVCMDDALVLGRWFPKWLCWQEMPDSLMVFDIERWSVFLQSSLRWGHTLVCSWDLAFTHFSYLPWHFFLKNAHCTIEIMPVNVQRDESKCLLPCVFVLRVQDYKGIFEIDYIEKGVRVLNVWDL